MKKSMDERIAELLNHTIESVANMIHVGTQNAKLDPRKNDVWDIVWIYPVPHKDGERDCEIVIGDRHTRFEPFVAWHCFDKRDYAWGHYCQTFGQAFMCADEKLHKEGVKREEI